MLSLYEKEFTINGVTSELAAMGEDIAEDAFALAKIINLLGEEGDMFANRAEQIERDVGAHTENVR